MASETPLLTVHELRKTYRVRSEHGMRSLRDRAAHLIALDSVSFSVRRHQVVGVVGESGSGKSTMAKSLVRLEEPDAGRVVFDGIDVLASKGRALSDVRRRMQMVYQDPFASLNPQMSIGRAIAEPARVHGLLERGGTAPFVANALERVGMSPALASRRPHELSGGQRQRVAIARAMSVQPELILADEAVSALDVSVQAQILNLFARLRDEQGVAIVFVAHDLSVVAHLADTVQVMYLGAIVESGPTAAVFAHPGHPYTRALLNAQPGRHRRAGHAKPTLRGEIPSPMAIPSGCRFRTRCSMVQDICAEVPPPTVDLGDGRTAICHFADTVA